MAEGKKSFVLYSDLIHTVKKMPNELRGELFMTILEYVNDENPQPTDLTIDLVFEGIKQQLKRDLKKYESRADRSRENGAKGGRPSKPKKPSGLNENPDEPKKPVSDNVSVNVNENISFIDKMNLYKKKIGEDDNVIWRDNVYRMHKLKPNNLFNVVELFTVHLGIQNNGKYNENFAEFRRHCSNWIGTQIQNGKLSEYRTVKAKGSI